MADSKRAPLLENEGGTGFEEQHGTVNPARKQKKGFLPFSNRTLFLFLGPILGTSVMFIPMDSDQPTVARCAGVAVWMAFWWVTEPIPISITALLPVILFPMIGVSSAKKAAVTYWNDKIFLLLGSFFVSQAVEKTNLHRRIALAILLRVGARPRALIAGFMIATALMSMWISNTATTAMMVPIAVSILGQLDKKPKSDEAEVIPLVETEGAGAAVADPEPAAEKSDDPTEGMDPGTLQYARGVIIAIAYSATLGGTATLVGTAPNVVLVGTLDTLFGQTISFTDWLIFALPLTLVFLVITWLYVCIRHYPWEFTTPPLKWIGGKPPDIQLDLTVFEEEAKRQGPMDFSQRVTLTILVCLAMSWFLRSPSFMPGWTEIFENPKYISDGTTAMFWSALLFLLPARKGKVLSDPILDKQAVKDVPWGIVILIGGGFALAKGFETSGLSAFLGNGLSFTKGMNSFLLLVFLTTFICFLTEFTSNVATSSLLLPILALLANSIGVNPLYLMIPATVACSYAFMFPVATPPNAIAFSTGFFTIKDMVRVGIWMNFIGIALLDVSAISFGAAIFKLNTVPDWAEKISEKDDPEKTC